MLDRVPFRLHRRNVILSVYQFVTFTVIILKSKNTEGFRIMHSFMHVHCFNYEYAYAHILSIIYKARHAYLGWSLVFSL